MSEELLVDTIRRYELLYNPKCEDYRFADKRQAAWEEVARIYGKNLRDCKDDWHRLRNCYNNAIKRRQNSRRKHLAPWRLEEKMSFLKQDDNCMQQEIEDYYINTRIVMSDNYSEDEGCDYLESLSSSESTQTPKIEPNKIRHSNMSNKRKANTSNITAVIDSKQRESTYVQEQRNEFDDTDHFFFSMSKMVKKLPPLDQIQIKLNLHKAINEVELSLLTQEQ